jgi:hypothetical protein
MPVKLKEVRVWQLGLSEMSEGQWKLCPERGSGGHDGDQHS